ncbi:MAG: signal peptide peptidase SppA [Proteobacteria bacterium]|nr:signal peptide peptidase SppA [Pseudomonadota bacterium]
MTLETDLVLDRRRLVRRANFWRVLAVLAVVAAVILAVHPRGPWFGGKPEPGRPVAGHVGAGSYIARLPVNGLITEDPDTLSALREVASDPDAAALIVAINSPGGTVAGGEALHDAISAVAKVKPVVAVMGGTAASAGYMIAVPAARIFARQATITGSIGVLLQSGDIAGLLKMLGITAEPIVSGPLKDQPSFVQPLSPQGREVLQGLVMDMYEQFVAMVAQGRHMDPARVRELGDGRAYTGRQAVALGLVDQIGGLRDARAWLASARGIPADLPVSDIPTTSFYRRTIGQWFGGFGGGLWKTVFSQGLILDGALAVWQPALK